MPMNFGVGNQNNDYYYNNPPQQQYVNPYYRQANNGFQNQQNHPQEAPLFGKVVNSLNDITPRDVPMNGQCGVFPVMDGSCIYIKSWTSNGTIDTVKYIPEIQETGPEQPSEFSQIMERLDKIENTLTQNRGSFNRNHSKQQKKFVNMQRNIPETQTEIVKPQCNNQTGGES